MSREAWHIARAVAASQDWLLTAAQAAECQLTPGELAGAVRRRELRRLYRGVYLFDPDLVQDPPARLVYRAALLSEGDEACLYGVAAARTWQVEGLPAVDDVIEVALIGGPSRGRTPPSRGHATDVDLPPVVVRQIPVAPSELRIVDGLRVRDVGLSVVDAALDLDRGSALSVLDSALHRGLVSPDELAILVAAAKGRPGIAPLRQLADLADARAESPLESRIRLICVDGKLAPDVLQHRVYDVSGLLVAVGDLGWVLGRRRPLLAEADGKVHDLPAAVYRDRRRGNVLVAAECDTVRFIWADTRRPLYVLYVVRSALAAA
jgi:hypothetical protein